MIYRLKKAETFLKNTWKHFQRNQDKLSDEVKKNFQSTCSSLKLALLAKNRAEAKPLSEELEALSRKYLKKSPIRSFIDFTFALLFALSVAIVIRQSCFELYEIPSGSMRPTYKEVDRLVVSKTQFGLNIPLTTSHLLFDPSLAKRMGVFTFTGENMDISNVKTKYFYLFPGYKQYIKRMIGLPGDTLYFYGGKIYGIDKNGNDISKELQKAELSYLEHIPFIQLEGKVTTNPSPQKNGDLFSRATIKQMNLPLATLYLSANKDVHYDLASPAPAENFDLHKLWGMGNFGTVRIVPKNLIQKNYLPAEFPQTDYYLEITHHASLAKAKIARDPYYRLRPMLHTDKSFIPLSEETIKTIWSNLYTGRIVSENGLIRRYGMTAEEARKNPYALKIKDIKIPDGTYEFYQGKLYEVKTQAITSEAPKDHPLAQFDIERAILLFNIGIECDTRFSPTTKDWSISPSRYTYFRNGDLYLMGAPVILKDNPLIQAFVSAELEKQALSPKYTPFIDAGEPLNADGTLNTDFIKTYGIKVPEKHYLALGDNHAMSADSRDFGFVPEDNVRGVPAFTFWAPGGRFGFPNHGIYQIITLPRLISWTLLLLAFSLYKYRSRRSLKSIALETLLP
jgi:signal peptidase I